MFQDLSAKYYKENKERLRRKTCKRYTNRSKEEKEKSNKNVVNVGKISQKMEKKLVEYRKIYDRM